MSRVRVQGVVEIWLLLGLALEKEEKSDWAFALSRMMDMGSQGRELDSHFKIAILFVSLPILYI